MTTTTIMAPAKLVVSDEVLAIFVPIAVYWAYSGVYMLLLSPLESYRLHPREDEDAKNLVSKLHVARGVLLQQLLQAAVAKIMFAVIGRQEEKEEEPSVATAIPAVATIGLQFMVAMVVVDMWQYFWHRYMHLNRFLYRHVHSWHHRLVVPYAFGSQYNHPVEGLLLDTAGGALAFLLSGMTPRASIFFFCFATVKGIDDHCGLWLPGINVFQLLFRNNTAYHDVHHQLGGAKYNFSQPFFVAWDRIMGTHMPYEIVGRPAGGFEARPSPPSPPPEKKVA